MLEVLLMSILDSPVVKREMIADASIVIKDTPKVINNVANDSKHQLASFLLTTGESANKHYVLHLPTIVDRLNRVYYIRSSIVMPILFHLDLNTLFIIMPMCSI